MNTNTTEELLVRQYGILMSIKDVAQLFKRTPGSLRVTLNNNETPFARMLNSARVKRGRKVVFKATAVALLIDDEDYEA